MFEEENYHYPFVSNKNEMYTPIHFIAFSVRQQLAINQKRATFRESKRLEKWQREEHVKRGKREDDARHTQPPNPFWVAVGVNGAGHAIEKKG